MKLRSLGILVAGLVASVGGVGAVNADSLDPTTPAQVSRSGVVSPFTYSINMSITGGSYVQGGSVHDGFALYDIPGTVTAANPLPSGWAMSLENNSIARFPDLGGANDNPALQNVVFTYTGVELGNAAFETLVGAFSFNSTSLIAAGTIINGGASYWSAPGSTNPVDHLNNSIKVAVTAVPVPAAAWSGLTTLVALAGMGLVRRRRTASV